MASLGCRQPTKDRPHRTGRVATIPSQIFRSRACLSVGNGEFAFTADATGLQTFPEPYNVIPLCTQSQWGWHSFPADGMKPSDLKLEMFDTHGREVGYATGRPAKGQEKLVAWLRENPHRLHLGRISLCQRSSRRHQRYRADTGSLDRHAHQPFRVTGVPVVIETCCHPERDLLAVLDHLAAHPSTVAIEFPYGSPDVPAADWKSPDRHRTVEDGTDICAANWTRIATGSG